MRYTYLHHDQKIIKQTEAKHCNVITVAGSELFRACGGRVCFYITTCCGATRSGAIQLKKARCASVRGQSGTDFLCNFRRYEHNRIHRGDEFFCLSILL